MPFTKIIKDGQKIYMARELFTILGADNYSQWSKRNNVTKVMVKDHLVDVLDELTFYRVVFASRSKNAEQVQRAVLQEQETNANTPTEAQYQARLDWEIDQLAAALSWRDEIPKALQRFFDRRTDIDKGVIFPEE